MPWPIRLHSARPDLIRVGDMFPAPWLVDRDHFLSPSYLSDRRAFRDPLVVRLPGPVDFCIDHRAWRDGVPYGDGWLVTGDSPFITLSPSINIPGIYHGYIRNGVISDDVEGRLFPGS